MPVTEQLMGHGSWSIRLDGLPDEHTPAQVWEALDPDANAFGHIVITPVRVDPDPVGDAGMLSMSRYTGIYRGNGSRNEIGGVGLVAWLGDEDDKGDISETPVTGTGGGGFDDWIADILPDSIASGTITVIAGTLAESMLYMTPRAMLNRVMEYFGGVYRVNPDFTLDAGTEADLFSTTPEIVLLWQGSGPGAEAYGIRASQIDLSRDLEDYTTRAVMLAEGQGATVSLGEADAGSVPYKDGLGNTVVWKRLINAPDVSAANADSLAAAQLGRFNQVRKAYSLSTDEWGVAVLKRGAKRLEPGDSIYVYDPRPDAKLVDVANQVTYQGQPIYPIILRLEAITWPIQEGMGVYFRYYSGATPVWVDLTNHVIWESGATTLDVGAAQRKLTTDPTPAQIQARITELTGEITDRVTSTTPVSINVTPTQTNILQASLDIPDHWNTYDVEARCSCQLQDASGATSGGTSITSKMVHSSGDFDSAPVTHELDAQNAHDVNGFAMDAYIEGLTSTGTRLFTWQMTRADVNATDADQLTLIVTAKRTS